MQLNLLALAFAGAISCGAAIAGDLAQVAPVFGRIVAFTTPDRFRPGDQQVRGPSYLLELVPRGQSVQSWGELFTLTGAQGGPTAAAFIDQIAAGYRNACPGSFTRRDLGTVGKAPAAWLSCGSLPGGYGENMVILAQRDGGTTYTLQWARRVAAGTATSKADIAERLAMLRRHRLCVPVPGEPAPYPSCTAG